MSTAVVAVLCWAVVMSSQGSSPPQMMTVSIGSDLPTGESTPEGVACDLVRAYIAEDSELFHHRRCKVACEGWADPELAFNRFLDHDPQVLGIIGAGMPVSGPLPRIEQVRQVAPDEHQKRHPTDLLFNYGVVDPRYFDVDWIDVRGVRRRIRVLTAQLTDWNVQPPKALGQWRGIVLAQSSGSGRTPGSGRISAMDSKAEVQWSTSEAFEWPTVIESSSPPAN